MANKVLLKKSSVGAKVPLTSDLDYGEIALNYADGKLFYKTSGAAIDTFASITATATLTNKTLSSATLTGTLTAGGGVGTSGQVLQSTGTGVQWASVAGGSGGTFTVASSAPSSPTSGDRWLHSTTGILYTYVDDGDSSQWVNLSDGGGSSSSTADTLSPFLLMGA